MTYECLGAKRLRFGFFVVVRKSAHVEGLCKGMGVDIKIFACPAVLWKIYGMKYDDFIAQWLRRGVERLRLGQRIGVKGLEHSSR